MKAECLVENIENTISSIGKVIPTSSQIPILSNILIQATKHSLFFSATDLELGIQIKIPAKIEEEGATTVSGKHFSEIIHSLPKDKLILKQEKETLMLKTRDYKIEFQTLAAEEFPKLFEEKGDKLISFSEEELKDIFLKIIFSVSQDEARPILSGILLYQTNGELEVVATDGYRLSLKRIKRKMFKEEEIKMVVSARLIAEALLLKTEGVDMFLNPRANQVIFETPSTTLVGRVISGDFPNYEKVIPKITKTKVRMDKEEFSQILKLCSVFARESANIVRFKITDGILSVSSSSQGVGEGTFRQEVEQEGEDNEIVFNIKFLLDLLRNITDERIIMEINSPYEPGVFKLVDDPSFLHVIMPVRVQEE